VKLVLVVDVDFVPLEQLGVLVEDRDGLAELNDQARHEHHSTDAEAEPDASSSGDGDAIFLIGFVASQLR